MGAFAYGVTVCLATLLCTVAAWRSFPCESSSSSSSLWLDTIHDINSIIRIVLNTGINILQPDTSAILHLESTDRGFLPPRMTSQQRDSIFDPKYGLTIFNTEDSTLQYFTGRCWMPVWQQSRIIWIMGNSTSNGSILSGKFMSLSMY